MRRYYRSLLLTIGVSPGPLSSSHILAKETRWDATAPGVTKVSRHQYRDAILMPGDTLRMWPAAFPSSGLLFFIAISITATGRRRRSIHCCSDVGQECRHGGKVMLFLTLQMFDRSPPLQGRRDMVRLLPEAHDKELLCLLRDCRHRVFYVDSFITTSSRTTPLPTTPLCRRTKAPTHPHPTSPVRQSGAAPADSAFPMPQKPLVRYHPSHCSRKL